jgi:hypothetical protein
VQVGERDGAGGVDAHLRRFTVRRRREGCKPKGTQEMGRVPTTRLIRSIVAVLRRPPY